MAYKRKTYDEYQVHGDYGFGHGFEVVCAEIDRAAAKQRLKEYQENEPGIPFKLKKVRVRIKESNDAQNR